MSRTAAPRRRHNADASGQHGKRFFARLIEKSLGLQALLQLLESELQRAHSRRLDVLDVNLIFAARFVHADRPAHDQLQAVLGPEFQAHGLRAETHAANLRLGVLQREIEMSGLRRAVVRDFALDPKIRELRGKHAADSRGQFRDAPDFSLRREIQIELSYFFSHCTIHRTSVRTTLSRIHVTTGK